MKSIKKKRKEIFNSNAVLFGIILGLRTLLIPSAKESKKTTAVL